MEFKKIYLTVSVIALTCSQYAVASPLDNTSHTHTHTQHTLELKPISNFFQTAAAIFLPDKGDDFGFNGRELNDNHGNTPQIDLCTQFPLSSCPTNAKCSKCPTGNKFKLNGCNDGFKLSSGTCVAKSCAEINSAYRADVPVNQVCSTISTYGKTCYQSCKTIDFSGYPITSCPANATCANHPDCATTSTKKGNCSPIKKKVTTCTLPSQKLNATASGCVNKDDTCPTTYFKSCETGTTGTAKYTELGTACYQCKPPCDAIYKYDSGNCMSPNKLQGTSCGGKFDYCQAPAKIGNIIYGDGIISGQILPGKTPVGIIFDTTKCLAVALNGVKKDGSSGYEKMRFSAINTYGIAGISNCDYTTGDTIINCETDGKRNTDAMLKMANDGTFEVASASNKYEPSGCNTNFCKRGQWFVPSMLELKNLYNAKAPVNSSLTLTKDWNSRVFPNDRKNSDSGITVPYASDGYEILWSSNPGYYGTAVWLYNIYSDYAWASSPTSYINDSSNPYDIGRHVRLIVKY